MPGNRRAPDLDRRSLPRQTRRQHAVAVALSSPTRRTQWPAAGRHLRRPRAGTGHAPLGALESAQRAVITARFDYSPALVFHRLKELLALLVGLPLPTRVLLKAARTPVPNTTSKNTHLTAIHRF